MDIGGGCMSSTRKQPLPSRTKEADKKKVIKESLDRLASFKHLTLERMLWEIDNNPDLKEACSVPLWKCILLYPYYWFMSLSEHALHYDDEIEFEVKIGGKGKK